MKRKRRVALPVGCAKGPANDLIDALAGVKHTRGSFFCPEAVLSLDEGPELYGRVFIFVTTDPAIALKARKVLREAGCLCNTKLAIPRSRYRVGEP